MEVILKQDLDGRGKAGAVIKVKDGFARNFLIPNGIALPASAANLKKLEAEKVRAASWMEKVKKAAEVLKEKLENFSLTIPVLAHEDEKLYGSITPQDIAQVLKDEGIELDKSMIALDEPIKSLGIYEVSVQLHADIATKIKVWIVKK